MELSSTQIEVVEKKTSLLAVSEENSAFEKLKETFGDHTYFLNQEGLFLFVLEDQGARKAQLIACAVWADDDQNKLLQLAEPRHAGLVLDLEKRELNQTTIEPDTVH